MNDIDLLTPEEFEELHMSVEESLDGTISPGREVRLVNRGTFNKAIVTIGTLSKMATAYQRGGNWTNEEVQAFEKAREKGWL